MIQSRVLLIRVRLVLVNLNPINDTYIAFGSTGLQNKLKGGPEPLENEINKILGSKREDRFSDHFSDLVQNI